MTKLFFFLNKKDILYINTVLPFGAGIAGRLLGCKVIYHIHETSIKPKILKTFLFGIAKYTAMKVVYVSKFLQNQEPLINSNYLLYNVLEDKFVRKAEHNKIENRENIILMICSLKKYKGVDEFLKLSQMNPDYIFELVVNSNQKEIDQYFRNTMIPDNLTIYPTQKDTHFFYKNAKIILNLSDIHLWIETFGLTILEGMCYHLPAIVPPVGGVLELVDDNENGFCISSKNLEFISEKIRELFDNPQQYSQFSQRASLKSKRFSEAYFEKESIEIISKW